MLSSSFSLPFISPSLLPPSLSLSALIFIFFSFSLFLSRCFQFHSLSLSSLSVSLLLPLFLSALIFIFFSFSLFLSRCFHFHSLSLSYLSLSRSLSPTFPRCFLSVYITHLCSLFFYPSFSSLYSSFSSSFYYSSFYFSSFFFLFPCLFSSFSLLHFILPLSSSRSFVFLFLYSSFSFNTLSFFHSYFQYYSFYFSFFFLSFPSYFFSRISFPSLMFLSLILFLCGGEGLSNFLSFITSSFIHPHFHSSSEEVLFFYFSIFQLFLFLSHFLILNFTLFIYPTLSFFCSLFPVSFPA